MNKQNIFFTLIIGVLLIIIMLQKCGCGDNININKNDTITTIDTQLVEVIKEIPTYVPKWKTKIEYIHDTTQIIDTAFVLGDYFSTYVYEDSLINDTLSLYINDSINQNKIKNRSIKYKLIYPIITITNNIQEPPKHEFYAGIGIAGNNNGINYFGPNVLWRNKKKSIYGLGIGINGNLQPSVNLQMYWKLGKK